MVKSQGEILLACTLEAAFAFIGEQFAANYPRWSPEVESFAAVTPGPMQVGWVGHQVRLDKGHRTESEFRCVAYEPHERVTFNALDDSFQVDYRLAPMAEGGSRLTFVFELRQLSPALRPFSGMVQRAIQASSEHMMVNLKRLLEQETPAAAG